MPSFIFYTIKKKYSLIDCFTTDFNIALEKSREGYIINAKLYRVD